MTYDSIAEGPRGRRMLLELATAAVHAGNDDAAQWELGTAVMNASYHLDPSPGSIFGPGADEFRRSATSPTDVAALLRTAASEPLTNEMVRDALIASVSTARYWQEPEGADALAATPPVIDAVSDTLAQLLLSGHATWWSTPVDLHTQFEVRWDSSDSASPENRLPGASIAQWRDRTERAEAHAVANWPTDPAASFSSDWWSTPGFGVPSSTRWVDSWECPAGLWLVEDSMGWREARVSTITTPVDLRVFEITGAADWAQLCAQDPIEVTAQKRHDWFRSTGRVGTWVMPDWTAVADRYDAIHLTVNGYLSAAGTAIEVDEGSASVLAGWAPDETRWLSDRITLGDPPSFWRITSDSDWSRIATFLR